MSSPPPALYVPGHDNNLINTTLCRTLLNCKGRIYLFLVGVDWKIMAEHGTRVDGGLCVEFLI